MGAVVHHDAGSSCGGEVGESCDIFEDEGVGFSWVAEALGEDLVTLHAPDGVFSDDTA